MSESAQETLDNANELTEKIAPILAHQEPSVVMTVLAEMASRFIAGHVVPDNPEGTAQVQEQVLESLTEFIEEMIPLQAQKVEERLADMKASGKKPRVLWSATNEETQN